MPRLAMAATPRYYADAATLLPRAPPASAIFAYVAPLQMTCHTSYYDGEVLRHERCESDMIIWREVGGAKKRI